MRKTVTITIGGSIFHIEEQAYDTLDTYLRSIREHFASYDDHDEIVSDIEGRMAEEFTERLKDVKRAAINDEDVAELMKRMGTVEDFAAFEGESRSQEREEPAPTKRLYRDPNNALIAGVASGIANYFQIDPIIVRGLFVASLFFGGAGILVYIVLWLIMPEAKTPSERAEMRGKPLTIKRIEETIREAIPEATKNIKPGTFARIIRFPFQVLRKIFVFLGKVVRSIVPILGRIIGFLILLGTVFALLFLTFWFVMLMTSSWEQYMDIPVRQLAGNVAYYTTLVTGYIVAFIPLVMILGIGLSLVQMKNAFRFNTVMTLLGVWMLALTAGAVTVARDVPAFHAKVTEYLEEYETEMSTDIAVTAFRSIEARHGYDVRVRRGTAYGMTVRGSQKAIDQLETSVDINGILSIRRNSERNRFCIICIGNHATIDLTVPSTLDNVSAHAGTSIDITDVVVQGQEITANAGSRIAITDVQSDTLNINATGGSRVEIIATTLVNTVSIESGAGSRTSFAGEVTNTTVEAYAGSRVALEGSGTTLTATLSSGSELTAADFMVRDATIDASSGGHAEIHVTGRLSGSATSGGSIRYDGNPTVEIDNNPSGHIEHMNVDDVEELEEPIY